MATIQVYQRTFFGTGSSRRLRLKNRFPAVIYGSNMDNIFIEVENHIIINQQKNKSFFIDQHILILDQNKIKVKIKDIQRHPFKLKIYHIDFLKL